MRIRRHGGMLEAAKDQRAGVRLPATVTTFAKPDRHPIEFGPHSRMAPLNHRSSEDPPVGLQHSASSPELEWQD